MSDFGRIIDLLFFVMATASDSPSAPVQSVNSVLDHHSRKEISDQKHVLAPEIFLVATPFSAKYGKPDRSENVGVKRVWNKPAANGVAPDAVMGAASWPALSKSDRVFTKASSTVESLEELSHGSITLSKGMSVDSWSSQEVVNSIVSPTNSASNHESPSTRQRSPELSGGSPSHINRTANGSLCQAPNSHSPVVEACQLVKSSSFSGVSPRDNTHRDVGQRGGSHGVREPHHHPLLPFRRNNSGPQLQGNGSFNHTHGNQRDHRSSVNLAPQRLVSGPFMRGPVSNGHFIPPSPPMAVWPYGSPVFYNDASSFMYYAPGPHSGLYYPIPNPHLPIPNPHLPSKIVRQIDYYFSDDNLVKDTFLRQKMDVDGWVSVYLIASFKKIRELTNNVQLILDALRASNVVEIQGEKVRRKGNWRKWIKPTMDTGSSPQSLNISSLRIHDEEKTDA